MIQIRKSQERGHFDHGWLNTYHTFSFADYYDPKHMAFRTLRVINEDTVQSGEGFGMHSHKDMEIVTYVTQGALEHKDSMGNTSVIRPGEIQRMSAGTGVQHSEFNSSEKELVHLLQIWILPEKKGITPGYEQKTVDAKSKQNKLQLIVSGETGKENVMVHQDAMIYASELEKGKTIEFDSKPERGVWIQMVTGNISVNGADVSAGDGAEIENETKLQLKGKSEKSEFLLFDLK